MNRGIEEIIGLINQIKPTLQNVNKSTVLNQGLLDSLDIITLVTLLEKEFDVKIAGTCLKQENFETVETLLEMIQQIKSE